MGAEQFGRYSLLHKLASGGMGEVWLARQGGPAGFDRFVAIKRLLPNLAENNEFVQMFLDEARLVARLNHPNICQVHEFGCENGCYYLAMEYLHGESLGSVIERSVKEKKPLDASISAYVLAEACEGLHFAHERKDEAGKPLGLVHRDVSPSNVFVSYDGNVKLLDFGIAKAAHRLTQTVAGAVKGKYGYIAPEVYQGAEIDRRVDVFALGVVFWEMLARKRLYRRATEYETLRAIVEEAPPDPRQHDPSIPAALVDVALKALEKEPAKRFQTAMEMRRALSAHLRTLDDELDATALAGRMSDVFGQVWIDVRSSVLESFKESSDISKANLLESPQTDSGLGAVPLSFARTVIPPPVATPIPTSGPVSSPARSQRSGWPWAAGAGAALALVAAGALWLQRPAPRAARPSAEEPSAALPVAAAAPAAAAVAPAAPAPPAAVAGPPAAMAAERPKPAAAPLPGSLLVRAEPASAEVRLDGSGAGHPVPASFGGLEPGSEHFFTVSAPGFESRRYEFTVASGAEGVYDVTLSRRRAQAPVARKPTRNIRTDEPLNPWGSP